MKRDGAWHAASALWVDGRGTLVAAASSVASADALIVIGIDGKRQTATLAGTDEATALAALVVDRTAGEPIELATRPPRTGEPAAAIGAPTGGIDDAVTVAAVVIRSAGQRSTVDGHLLHDSLPLDRALPADVTGGAVVNGAGQLIGVLVGTSDQHLATAVPAELALDAASSLRQTGRVERAWLGVRAVDLDPTRSALYAVAGGAHLTEVTEESPAAHAGLHPGDVVVAVAGRPVDDASDLVVMLRSHTPGTRVTMTVLRGTEELHLTATLG